ncbi:MAG: uracil-DNA glycosylase [Candidatus Paceibacterales bacterium]
MSKNKRLEKLHQEIRRCKKCELYKTKINAVPGEGPANTEVIFIGQNPGLNEAKTGKPFIGMAGKFLNKLLEIAKINRNEVFITSVLKCRTPKNRKPTKKEIKTCLPYLKKQIEVINPKKFILLGEVAFSVFFPKEKLKNFRGKLVKENNKEFFVTYHPAAGIRSPKRIRKILEKDFKKIKNLI